MIGNLQRYNRYKLGTVLRVNCPGKGVYHYGIASYNNTVIDRAPRKGIARRSMWEFSEGQRVEIIPHEQGDFSLRDTHNRALSFVGNPKYNMINANCEHFISFCKRGVSESKQVQKVGEYAFAGVLFLGIWSLLSGGTEEDELT